PGPRHHPHPPQPGPPPPGRRHDPHLREGPHRPRLPRLRPLRAPRHRHRRQQPPRPPGLVRAALRPRGREPPRPALTHHEHRDRAHHPPALLSRTTSTPTALTPRPPEILEDPSGSLLTNLAAALQLGIETRFGGSISNLDVDVIAHPADAGHEALLLSDTIVGGTGYLMELATAASVWDLLAEAHRALAQCPCRDEGLAACHRCLLPYARPEDYEAMRRTVALEALEILLRTDAPQPGAM